MENVISHLNEDRKTYITKEEVLRGEVKVSWIKKIDEIFNKGIAYYLDPSDPIKSKEESIFFRKDNFNAKLSLGAKQIVNKFEEDKISFATLAKLSDYKIKRKLPVFKISDTPEVVASTVREFLYPAFVTDKRDFLKNFIAKLADYNILVFEFVEAHNKKEKANLNGFFLSPNVIVLKRNQKSYKREIFTLAHELGHYLLNEEEIDEYINEENTEYDSLNTIEKWCNDFAYFFLIGTYKSTISTLTKADSSNDYHHSLIDKISSKTHLSTLALYTRLLINNLISSTNYGKISFSILESIKEWERKEKEKMELQKQKDLDEGRVTIIPPPKPIISPLYLKTLQGALFSGLINEADFCKKLNIKADKIEKYIL